MECESWPTEYWLRLTITEKQKLQEIMDKNPKVDFSFLLSRLMDLEECIAEKDIGSVNELSEEFVSELNQLPRRIKNQIKRSLPKDWHEYMNW